MVVDKKIINDLSDLSGVEHLDISENVHGLMIYADPMLNKVFHNIFENSIKYSGRPAGVRIIVLRPKMVLG